MSLSAERTEAFTEAFEIFGKKAPDIDKHTLSVIMRSLGQNPTNDEVTELFNQEAAGGSKIGLDKVLKIGAEFEAKMNSTDQHAALKEAFAVFDKDKKGKISAACARAGSLVPPLTPRAGFCSVSRVLRRPRSSAAVAQ